MYLNNSKSSLHPSNIKNSTNYNTISTPTYSFFTDGKEPINYQNQSITSSVELALITVNLSWVKFKSMTRHELEVYVKAFAYNNSFESKKYLLALDILFTEMDKTHNNIIKQILPINKSQPEKSYLEKAMGNKINLSETICIESDDFNLLTKPNNNFQTNGFLTQANNNLSVTNNGHNSFDTYSKNLDMSTYTGNPFNMTKITNSLKTVNQPKNNFTENYSDNSVPQTIMHNGQQYQLQNNTNQVSQPNNIIQQTSLLSSQTNVQFNGGRRRTSNMDVGNSNNYVTIG